MKSAGISGRIRRKGRFFLLFAALFTAALLFLPVRMSRDAQVMAKDTAVQAKKFKVSVTRPKGKKRAELSWTEAAGTDFYKILRSTKKDSGFQEIASADAGCLEYTDTGTAWGNYYYYRVDAVGKDGKVVSSSTAVFACPLKKVTGVRLIRYSGSSIKVTWDSHKNAGYYKVYYGKDKSKLKSAGTTKNTWLRVKKLAKNTVYYFQVTACADADKNKTASGLESPASATVKMQTKTYSRTTVFAGDSITTGFDIYNTLGRMEIGGNKKTVAAVGLNTSTFRTRKVFSGKSALETVNSLKPYRLYMMLGINEIHFRNSQDVVAGYKDIVQAVQKASPNTDIVILAISPVTRAEQARRSGFAQIPACNEKLKALAEKLHVRYYDYTGFLKDSSACLKTQYAAADGVHWKVSAYNEFARVMQKYDRSLD